MIKKNRRKSAYSSPPPELLFLAFPTAPLRGLAGRCSCVFCHQCACRPLDVCCSENSKSAWLHRSSANSSVILVRYLPQIGPGSLVQDGRPEGLLLAFPLRAVLEQMLASLNLILASPTAGVRASSGPRKVLSCQTVPRLELVEAGDKALVGRRIRLLLFTGGY